MLRAAIAVLVMTLACSSKPPTVAGPGSAAKLDDPTCPVLVAGTSLTVEDTDTGAAFVFVTTGDAAAVRTRSRALAEMHNQKHAAMTGPQDHAGHGDDHAMQMGSMIGAHSTATVTDIEGGARITFVAHDPAALQAELRMHAKHLGGGTCEM